MAYREYFPASMLALQEELKNWPMISAEAQHATTDAEAVGIIAARLGILLDGMYDLPDLCAMLVKKLRELRREIIIDPNYKAPQTIDVTIKEGANTVTIERVPNPSPKKVN